MKTIGHIVKNSNFLTLTEDDKVEMFFVRTFGVMAMIVTILSAMKWVAEHGNPYAHKEVIYQILKETSWYIVTLPVWGMVVGLFVVFAIRAIVYLIKNKRK